MTHGQINLLAYDIKRQSGLLHRISKIAPTGRAKRNFERAAVDCNDSFEQLRTAAQGEYHDIASN